MEVLTFNRYWVDYENGFDSLTNEFWYRLHAIHYLTNLGQWYLHIQHFKVGSAAEKCKLTIHGCEGVTADPLAASSLIILLDYNKFDTEI